MLAGPDILFRFRSAGLLEHRIQIILSDMAFEGSAGFGFRTLLFQFERTKNNREFVKKKL